MLFFFGAFLDLLDRAIILLLWQKFFHLLWVTTTDSAVVSSLVFSSVSLAFSSIVLALSPFLCSNWSSTNQYLLRWMTFFNKFFVTGGLTGISVQLREWEQQVLVLFWWHIDRNNMFKSIYLLLIKVVFSYIWILKK